MRKQVLLLIITLIFILTICGAVTAANSTTDRVSVASNGSESDSYSSSPSISGDGRYVAFSSYADNLVANDINGHEDVFVRDRLLNTTKLVSVSSTGEQGNSNSIQPSISADGRYVAFTSYGDNLVASDNNGFSDIFVRDLILNITTIVSVSSAGEEGDNPSYEPSISSDGRYIAFSSQAHNLVADDDNYIGIWYSNIFVYDQALKTIEKVSWALNGEQADRSSFEPSISGGGRYVAFSSEATNLVINDINYVYDIFVFDRLLKTMKRVSISTNGDESNSHSYNPSISANGRYIAFTSSANNLISGDNNYRDDIFVYDQLWGITWRVSVSNAGEEFTADCNEPSISADGHYVAFTLKDNRPKNSAIAADAPLGIDLPLNYSYFVSQVLVYDMISGTTKVVSISNTEELGSWDSVEPSINADGSAVAFSSYAENLITNDTNNAGDIFVRGSEPSSTTPINPPYTPPNPINPIKPVIHPVITPIKGGKSTVKAFTRTTRTSSSVKSRGSTSSGSKITGFLNLGVRASGPGNGSGISGPGNSAFNSNGKTPSEILNHYFGNQMPSALKDNSFLVDLIGWTWGSNPFTNSLIPGGYQFSIGNYFGGKLVEAAQNAWQTGNIWDFFNYNFYHIQGYSNLDNVWGGQNIKTLLDWGLGIDENGDMSVANAIIDLLSIIPIGRAASIGGRLLADIVERSGLKISLNLGENFLRARTFIADLIRKLDLKNPETWNKLVDFLGNALLPNPVGIGADILKNLAKLTGNEKLIAVTTAFSNFMSKRGLGDLANLLINSNPMGKIKESWGTTINWIENNAQYLGNTVKTAVTTLVNKTVTTAKSIATKAITTTEKLVNNAVTTAKQAVTKAVTTAKTIVTKAVTTAKNIVNKAVTTVKKVATKVVTTAKKVVNKVVTTAKKVVSKVVITAKKVVNNAVKTVKNVVNKAVNTAKQVVNTAKNVVTSGMNWIKSKIRLPW